MVMKIQDNKADADLVVVKGPVTELSSKQQVALCLLASGQSYTAVAEEVGVVVGTLRNWCSGNSAFKQELVKLRADLHYEAQHRLRSLTLAATDALHSVLTDPQTAARDRISAARTVFQFTLDTKQIHRVSTDKGAAQSIAEILQEWESVE